MNEKELKLVVDVCSNIYTILKCSSMGIPPRMTLNSAASSMRDDGFNEEAIKVVMITTTEIQKLL